MVPEQTSLTLLERVRAHDQDAWGRLVALYAPLVANWCQRWNVRGADAEDVRQEVFHAVSAGLVNFHRDRTNDTFRGWLRGITRNKLLDFYRRRDRQPAGQGGTDAHKRFLEVPMSDDPLTEDSEEETSGLYNRALELVRAEFEAKTWEAFWRSAVDGQSPALIAADLGVTPAAVRKAKSRVLRRLKEEVGDVMQ